jgi:predicted porin
VAVAVQYADGPLVLDGAYLTNENAGDKGHYRASASYDFGVAKVAGGFERAAVDAPAAKKTTTDMLLGVSVPVGAVTLGANWAQRQLSDQAVEALNNTTSGYGLKATYNLSKRTAISADYASWKARDINGVADANNTSQYNLLLSHSF